MAWVALEFENDRILVATARAAGKRIQVQHLLTVDIQGADGSVAEQLKAALSEQGGGRGEALVVVNRTSTEVRLLDVPPAPDNELPDIVRFVARNEFATLNDNWLLDFIRLSGSATEPGQVLAAGVSPEMSNQIRAMVEATGLKLRHMVLRPFAAVDLVADQIQDSQPRILIAPNKDSFDLTLVRGRELAATRTVRVPGTNPAVSEFLVPQIQRMLTSSRRALQDQPVEEVLLFGDAAEQADLVAAIESELELSTRCLDPLALGHVTGKARNVPEHSRFAALLGALHRQSEGPRHAIDFLNPRRPVVTKRDFSKVYLWGGVALAASLFLVALGWWTLSSQSAEIDELTRRYNELKQRNDGAKGQDSVDQVLAEVGEIDQWVLNQVNWQEELLQYSTRALTPDDTIVDLFDAQIGGGGEPARAIVNARAADFRTEGQLISALSDRFEVRPTRTGDADDPDYPISTSLRVSLITPEDNDREALQALNRRAAEFVQQAVDQRKAAAEAANPAPSETPTAEEPQAGEESAPPASGDEASLPAALP